jgi:DNA-binding transcriptional regulator YdaS (Cro superfamily)
MTPNEALQYFRTKTKIGMALGLAPSTVSEWFEIGYIPEGRQYQIELATNGDLKADKPACRIETCQEPV